MSARPPQLQQYFDRGTQAMSQGEYDGAVAWFAAVVEINPRDTDALELYEKCQILLAQKGLNPLNKILFSILGNLAYLFQIPKLASHYLGILSVDRPHDAKLAAKYAKMLMALEQPALASLAYRRALQFMPKNKAILKGAGPVFEAIDDRPTAIEVYHQLTRLEPKNAKWALKVKDLSAEHYGDSGGISDLTSHRADEERKAAEQQTVEGKEDRIKVLLDEYKENPEEKAEVLPEVGRLLFELEKYDHALSIWNRVLDSDSEDEEAAYMVALGEEKKGNLESSIEGYTDLLDRFPNEPKYCDALYGAKIELLDRKIDEVPEDATLVQQREKVEKDWHRKKIEIYRELVEKRVGDPDLLMTYGNLLADYATVDEAIPVLQKASQNPARAYPALCRLGWLFIEKGNMALAIDTFERALEKAPYSRSPTAEVKGIWYGLGEAHLKQGDNKVALDWFKRIYECDVEFRDIRTKYETLLGN